MKFRNMKISKQTNITLVIILLMIIILSAYTLFSINTLWNHTAGIYEHPLTVTQAADKIEVRYHFSRSEYASFAYQNGSE